MTPSPSGLRMLPRRVVTATLRRFPTHRVQVTARPFSSSLQRYDQDSKADSDVGLGRKHTVDKAKEGDPNVQSYESSEGQSNRAQDTGGTATRERDERGSTAKTKKEFPEAPDVILGMQDERGGKGA